MNHRRTFYLSLSGVILTLVLCLLYTQPVAVPAPLAVFAQEPPATPETVTLRWFMRWDETRVQQIALPLSAAFEAQHPTIRIQLENSSKSSDYYRTLNVELNKGDGPDLFYPATHIAYALALQDLLLPLDGWVAADEIDLADFDPETLALYQSGEQLHCLPADIATLVVFYNKERFAAAGVPEPQAPWQWDDLLTTAQQLTADMDGDGQIDTYGIDRFDAYWPLVVWTATGHNVFDDPYAPTRFLLEEETAIAALQWYADLSLVHEVMPPIATEEDADDMANRNRFLTGEAAMQIGGHWQIPAYQEQAAFPFDFAELPVGNFAANRSDGSCFAIARNTEHPAAAWEFVKFLAVSHGAGAQFLTAMQQMVPALQTLQDSDAFLKPSTLPPTHKAAFLPETDQRFPLYDPLHPIYSRWAAVADEELDSLWRGEESAETVVATMAEEVAEMLDNLAPSGDEEQTAGQSATGQGTDGQRADEGTLTTGGEPMAQLSAPVSPLALPRHYYVAPDGDDEAMGESPVTAFATLQHALAIVQPGDTIHLLPGDYFETVVSVVDGRATAPITIMGPPDAVLHGADDSNIVFYLTHNYYTLVGFTMDGLYGDPDQQEGYMDKLLYVQGKQVRRGVTGLRVLNMTFQNAGGECLRLRYFARNNEIAYSTFTTCGLYDFAFAGGGKNGEAIYIGTSSTQWADGKNPTAEPDQSTKNWVHHNVINTQGNECVEAKEGSSANLIEYNTCTGQLDPDSAGIGSRGNGNIIRYNRVYGNVGAGVRLGGHEVDDLQYGVQNEVYGNQLVNNVAGGVNIAVGPQARICENFLAQNLGKRSFGDASDEYNPIQPCQ
ncbi:MAG: extracellular solute-binding protein [Caldilineaceae bacterium]